MKNKPCPFCMSENLRIEPTNVYVQCDDCGAFGPSANINPFSNLQQAIVISLVWDKWNERFDS